MQNSSSSTQPIEDFARFLFESTQANDFPLNGKSSTIDFNDKPDDLPQCFDNSIETSNNDTNTNPSNQYKMRRDNLKKFATLSRANAKYNYLRQLTLTLKLPNRNVMTKFG